MISVNFLNNANYANWIRTSDYEMNQDEFGIMYDWCDETFGEDMWYSEYKEVSDIDVYYFKKEEHRSWFLIRWAV